MEVITVELTELTVADVGAAMVSHGALEDAGDIDPVGLSAVVQELLSEYCHAGQKIEERRESFRRSQEKAAAEEAAELERREKKAAKPIANRATVKIGQVHALLVALTLEGLTLDVFVESMVAGKALADVPRGGPRPERVREGESVEITLGISHNHIQALWATVGDEKSLDYNAGTVFSQRFESFANALIGKVQAKSHADYVALFALYTKLRKAAEDGGSIPGVNYDHVAAKYNEICGEFARELRLPSKGSASAAARARKEAEAKQENNKAKADELAAELAAAYNAEASKMSSAFELMRRAASE